MRKFAIIVLLAGLAIPASRAGAADSSRAAGSHALMAGNTEAARTQVAADGDQTLRAMHDELERSRERLVFEGMEKPFYIEYRLLDLDVRSVTATFGALVASTTARSRFMSVNVRVGDYHLDSSNFVSEDGFQGFLGSTGQVGIDRDYNSLRQDLWLATDQAYKEAATQMALKEAFLRSLTKPPEIDDFGHMTPITKLDPRIEPDWTTRKWEDEARAASAVLRDFPQLFGTRVNYSLIYLTTYLVNSEGTTLRTSSSLAAVEAALDTQAADGMPLHNYYAVYVARPADLPDSATVSKGVAQAGTELMELRSSPLVPDFSGPVLFDASASGSMLAQVLAPSIGGARPPLSMLPAFDQIMERMGARSEWTGRVGTRVLPSSVTLVDDPTLKDFQGQLLHGNYEIDDEGVNAQRVALVENGILRNLLMSRRPGPDFENSNGHGRSGNLSTPQPLASNLFLQSSEAMGAADLRKKFLDACRTDGHEWCIEVKRMDNPGISSVRGDDFSEFLGAVAGGLASGERIPLLIYKVYVADGRKELVRGGRIEGLNLRTIRNILGVGGDPAVYTYMQSVAGGFAGSALGSFGSAQGGIPSAVIAPSLLLEEVDVRGFHGEPRRLPLVAAPPLK